MTQVSSNHGDSEQIVMLQPSPITSHAAVVAGDKDQRSTRPTRSVCVLMRPVLRQLSTHTHKKVGFH